MESHWSKYLTLSVVHCMAYPDTMKGGGPILETVRAVAEDEFFSGIEISWINDPAVRRQVRDLLEVSHLPAAFAAQPTLLTQKLDLNSPDPEMRARAIRQLKEDVDQAAELGITRLATISGSDPGNESDRKEALCWLTESMHEVCGYARACGIGVTMETFDRTIDKKALIGPAHESAAFSSLMRKSFSDFGLMYDLSHQPLLDEETLPTLYAIKDHLVHAHVGNCVKKQGCQGYGDQHPRFGFPNSENDVEQLTNFLAGLFAIGYLGKTNVKPWVGIEVKPQPGESSDVLLAGTRRVWIEAWARL